MLPNFVLTALLTAYAASVAAQVETPIPNSVSYGPPVVNNSDANPNGTPCGPNSVGKTVSGDNTFVTLIFDNLSATIGPREPRSSNRGYCDVQMDIQAAEHIYSFAIDILDYRGYARIDKGVNATITAHHEFLNVPVAPYSQTIIGPMSSDFAYRQNNTFVQNRFGPCTRTTRVKVAVAVELASSDPNATGFIAEDSVDLSAGGRNAANITLKFAIKNCLRE